MRGGLAQLSMLLLAMQCAPGFIADGCRMTQSGDHAALGEAPKMERRSAGDSSAGLLQQQQQGSPGSFGKAKVLSRGSTVRLFV